MLENSPFAALSTFFSSIDSLFFSSLFFSSVFSSGEL